MRPTADELAYIAILGADIAKHGGILPGQTMQEAVQAAHRRRQAFAEEMIEQRTPRAKLARRALAADVYLTLTARSALSDLDAMHARELE